MKKLIILFTLVFAICGTEHTEENMIRIKIIAGDKVLTATLYDNAAAKSFAAMLPMTLPMEDLYAREMCYHMPTALPTNEARRETYEVGDISYWPPGKSFVIFYKQNGEIINLQKIGRIDAGVDIFENTGDIDVRFELL